MTITLYHNPRCAKSRAALKLLQDNGAAHNVVRYLDAPPSVADLKRLARLLGCEPRGLIRTSEPIYHSFGLANPDLPENDLFAALAAHPILLQRPIGLRGKEAIIARPPELILELL